MATEVKKTAPRTFDTSYNVKNACFPSDLMDDEQYGGNYVVFYINIHADSYLAKDKVASSISSGVTSGQQSALSGTSASSAKPTADVTPTTLGTANQNTTVSLGGVSRREYKRMAQAIALHMPTDLSTKYSAEWESMEFGAGAVLEKVGAMGLVGALTKKIPLAGAITALIPADMILGAASKLTGVAVNPKKEQLFKQVDFRTFSFNYQFFARSEAEASNIREIIKLFKLHMHPEFTTIPIASIADFMYIYPSEFDIVYYQNGNENMNIHRHTSCVLTDMSVTYTPQSTFSAFKDGMPTQINVNMTFKELAILTKENIEDGY